MPTRKASATWEGGLQGGTGKFQGESGAIQGAYSVGSRFGEDSGTNPEELLAAAEAACFSMALALGLDKSGHKPDSVHTDAACTVEKQGEGFTITTIELNTRVRVAGLDESTFQDIAQKTKAACPVSKALAGVQINLTATMES